MGSSINISAVKILFILCSTVLSSVLVGYTPKKCGVRPQEHACATNDVRSLTLDNVLFTSGEFVFRLILQTEDQREFVGDILESSDICTPQDVIFCLPDDYTGKYALFYEVLEWRSAGAITLALSMEQTSFVESFSVGMSYLGCRPTEIEQKQFLRTFQAP